MVHLRLQEMGRGGLGVLASSVADLWSHKADVRKPDPVTSWIGDPGYLKVKIDSLPIPKGSLVFRVLKKTNM